jgi:hypothetical protein
MLHRYTLSLLQLNESLLMDLAIWAAMYSIQRVQAGIFLFIFYIKAAILREAFYSFFSESFRVF